MSNSLQPHGLYSPWNSPGRNTGVGSLSLLQRIFPTQESNPGFPHCRQILYQLRHKGNPRTLAWVAYSFSSRSSQPRNQIRVSCIAGSELWGQPKDYDSSLQIATLYTVFLMFLFCVDIKLLFIIFFFSCGKIYKNTLHLTEFFSSSQTETLCVKK